MIRIRCITSPALPIARDRVAQVEDIFSENFPALADYANKIPELLANPFKHEYQTTLIISETTLGKVTGFALLLHFSGILRFARNDGAVGSAAPCTKPSANTAKDSRPRVFTLKLSLTIQI